MKNFDAVIVGAGPAGSATAIALARLGYQVALVDRQTFPRDKLCGDFINPINWAVFRDLGVADRILAEPHGKVTGFRITSSSGRQAEADFRSPDGQSTMGVGVQRAALDQLLMRKAEELGATTSLGCRVGGIFRTAQGWQMKAGQETWQAKCLIGADGRNSSVARALGLNRRGAVRGRAIGFQSRLRCPGAADGHIEIHLFPGGYAGLVGLGDGTFTLAASLDKRQLERERGAQFLFDKVLAQNPFLRRKIARSHAAAKLRSVYPVYFPERACVADRALLVGDAARVSEPVTGEGIYFAMRSGLLAAETIDRGLRRGNLAMDGLACYEQCCRATFRSRLVLNSLLRFAVYRPAFVEPWIRLSAQHGGLLHTLVDAVCLP